MNGSILATIITSVINIISTLGYGGVFILMTFESALIPIPSEVIMPFAGFLASQGKFNLLIVVLVGASGNLFGSLIAYSLGYYGQKTLVRKLITKYGKFILLTEEDFDKSLKLFSKYGQWIIAASRVLPVIRTVISLPAGIAKLKIWKFSVLTFFGSLIWSYFLAYIGFILGQNWQIISPYFRKFDILIIVAVIIAIAWYLFYKLKPARQSD